MDLLKKLLFKNSKNKETPSTLENFHDLAPVKAADPDGIYTKALNFAMQNRSVRNLAITGPYGSGKTSIINTYENNSNYNFLNISLATFNDPNSNETSDDNPEATAKIERSILQQMLYGADSRKLPYSRFKRITKPRQLKLNAIMLSGWLALSAALYKKQDDLSFSDSLKEVDWLWTSIVALCFLYLAWITTRALQTFHNLSVKKLSLQNGEVELDGIPESSILNKYLDEIIYFFEENNYDLVVFEDLDRFGEPEIFIKLREVNKIINDKRGNNKKLAKKQPLKFVYAIKDDMFLNKDRAKFFDFIIPVIPIINSSNSREMLKQCLQRPEAIAIDEKFIGEVSLYLDDMRLIKNISNEFLIYEKKINAKKLNRNKLLAAILYKNTYPKDFEALHYESGFLYEIIKTRSNLILDLSEKIDKKIEEIKADLIKIEDEPLNESSDLAKLFLGHIISTNPSISILGVYCEGSVITVENLLDWNNFKRLFKEKEISVRTRPQYGSPQHSLSKSFRELEEDCSPSASFEERYKRIQEKNINTRLKLSAAIEKLKEEKLETARRPLYQLLRDAKFTTDSIEKKHSINDPRLLRYLIRNGHLDETYNSYISIFHEGRLSRNDWEFILSIRDFKPLAPETQLTSPQEVSAEMRREDFGTRYALNVNLVDYLIATKEKSNDKVISLIRFISKDISITDEFFQTYWITGTEVENFTIAISNEWPQYAISAIESELAVKHVAHIISYVDPKHISTEMNEKSKLTKFLSGKAALVFNENIPFKMGYSALEFLDVKINSLHDISTLDKLIEFAHQKSLYKISIDNINLLLSRFNDETAAQHQPDALNVETSNYSYILNFGSTHLKSYIHKNIDSYLENIALTLSSNTKESKQAILEVLNNDDVDVDLALQYIIKQDYIAEDFDKVPDFYWGDILINRKIKINWKNILDYYGSVKFEVEKLNEILNNKKTSSELSTNKIPAPSTNDEQSKSLSRIIITNNKIDIENYRLVCKSIPYTYKEIPEDLPENRALILIDLGIISLTEKSFAQVSKSTLLAQKLLARKITTYLQSPEKFQVTPEIKAALISAPMEITHKSKIIEAISIVDLQQSNILARSVATAIANEDLPKNNIAIQTISYCIVLASNNEKIEILHKYILLLPTEDIISTLSSLPEPYHSISEKRKRPKIDNNLNNMDFVQNLKARGLISSWKQEGDSIRINTFR
ncbi:hypothetical protein AAER22_21635 [Pseudomonas aeruginosa]